MSISKEEKKEVINEANKIYANHLNNLSHRHHEKRKWIFYDQGNVSEVINIF